MTENQPADLAARIAAHPVANRTMTWLQRFDRAARLWAAGTEGEPIPAETSDAARALAPAEAALVAALDADDRFRAATAALSLEKDAEIARLHQTCEGFERAVVAWEKRSDDADAKIASLRSDNETLAGMVTEVEAANSGMGQEIARLRAVIKQAATDLEMGEGHPVSATLRRALEEK